VPAAARPRGLVVPAAHQVAVAATAVPAVALSVAAKPRRSQTHQARASGAALQWRSAPPAAEANARAARNPRSGPVQQAAVQERVRCSGGAQSAITRAR
jgi:hypothetical protein